MKYEHESYDLTDGPLEVEGRVVGVLDYNPHNHRVTVLVEKPDADNLTFGPANDSEGVDLRGKAEEQIVKSAIPGSSVVTRSGKPECGYETDNGPCSRTVKNVGDRCWQHAEEDDES